MGPIGVPEMMAIFVIALLLFGPKKLPELGRTLGKALTEFRRAKNELKNTFDTHMAELEREARAAEYSQPKQVSSPAPAYSYESSYRPYDETGALSEPPVESGVSAPPPPATISTPVEGAVARSNGSHAVSSTLPNQEEHPA